MRRAGGAGGLLIGLMLSVFGGVGRGARGFRSSVLKFFTSSVDVKVCSPFAGSAAIVETVVWPRMLALNSSICFSTSSGVAGEKICLRVLKVLVLPTMPVCCCCCCWCCWCW
uniref:Putative secreted peptide n=1 Tax=Anopheles braziliensis TaxID=58242 RepID=A0A2M3ZNZ6_9DIPT